MCLEIQKEIMETMAGSSIHFAPIEKSTTHNFFHNAREDKREPSYLLPKEHRQSNETNKSGYEALSEFNELAKSRSDAYTKSTGQKLQKKTRLLYSAVINLEEHHSLKDIEPIINYIEKSLDTKVIQSTCHHDEGHISKDDNKPRYNHHCHLEIFGLNSQGRGIAKSINKEFLSNLQEFVSKQLSMEYEKGSNRVHITHKEFREHKKLEQITISQEIKQHKFQEQIINIIKSTAETIKKFFMSEQIAKLEKENILLKRQASEQQSEIARQSNKLKSIIEEAEHYKTKLITELSKYLPIQKPSEQPKQKQHIQQIHNQEQQHKTHKSLSRSI
jgi:hypothetical protein